MVPIKTLWPATGAHRCATVEKTALRFIPILLSPPQLPTCSNCRTIFPSCRP